VTRYACSAVSGIFIPADQRLEDLGQALVPQG
jgi:hypothetical protein